MFESLRVILDHGLGKRCLLSLACIAADHREPTRCIFIKNMYCSTILEAGRAEDRHWANVDASLCRCGSLKTTWYEFGVICGGPVDLRVVRGNLCIAEPNAPATVHNMAIVSLNYRCRARGSETRPMALFTFY